MVLERQSLASPNGARNAAFVAQALTGEGAPNQVSATALPPRNAA
jgi:hypothetical protein